MKYKEPEPIGKKEAEEAFLKGDIDQICDAMVAVSFYETDWEWAQNKFLDFLNSEQSDIRGLAATCLGHLARIHGQLERERVVSALWERLDDAAIAGKVGDALDDIQMFLE